MSVEQCVRNLNQLEKDIADLEKKLSDELKKESDKNKRINSINKSINKNTSASSYNSKIRQIQGYQNDISKILVKKSEINKKIADKRKKRVVAIQKLQKEELSQAKKIEKKQQETYKSYDNRIKELNSQLSTIENISYQNSNLNLYNEKEQEEYDVFISHASEDKESFANDLYTELKSAGVKVWYDDLCITWGDSLRSKIDSGLKKSKYGIVILSNHFIKKGWTQYELDGLFQIEMTGGKTILPIWHNISKKEVQDFSPTLAGRMALNSAMMTPSEIAEELVNILNLK